MSPSEVEYGSKQVADFETLQTFLATHRIFFESFYRMPYWGLFSGR
jgi:hypothetical protein